MKVEVSKEMDKSKEGEGSPMLSLKRRYLPLELRIKLYKEVHRLRKEGLSYSKIIEEIYKKYGIKLHISKIYQWINGKCHPLTKLNKFNDKPTPELAYIIGTMLGDGTKYYYRRSYTLYLEVKDKDFAETFAENLAKILLKKKSYKPFYSPIKRHWIVAGYSKFLYDFLNKPLKELITYIEYNRNCVSAFLRGLFDSEGSIRKGGLVLYNTNRKLLEYADYLLKKFDIDTSLYLIKKARKTKRFPNGKISKTTKNEYELYIRAKSLMNFYKYIRFSIGRKQQSLEEAIENQK